MSRAFGGRSFITLPPRRTSPSVISSSPATMRSALVLPHPDGPTKTTGSLSGKWLGFGNYRAALHDQIFRDALWHTVVFTVISQAIVIVCAGLLAHALVRRFRGRWALRFLVLLPWAAPIALTAIGFLWFCDPQASPFPWSLVPLTLADKSNVPNWLGTPRAAMSSIITVQAWRILPFATV